MENPTSWGPAEHVVQDAYRGWSEARDSGVCGASLAITITSALRNADLLKEDS